MTIATTQSIINKLLVRKYLPTLYQNAMNVTDVLEPCVFNANCITVDSFFVFDSWWPITHIINPMTLFFVNGSFLITVATIFYWETLEVVLLLIFNGTYEVFLGENGDIEPVVDMIVGDIFQGHLGILLGVQIMFLSGILEHRYCSWWYYRCCKANTRQCHCDKVPWPFNNWLSFTALYLLWAATLSFTAWVVDGILVGVIIGIIGSIVFYGTLLVLLNTAYDRRKHPHIDNWSVAVVYFFANVMIIYSTAWIPWWSYFATWLGFAVCVAFNMTLFWTSPGYSYDCRSQRLGGWLRWRRKNTLSC